MYEVQIRLVNRWRLNVLMLDRGLSNEDLADKLAGLGMPKSTRTIRRWKNATTRPPILADEFDMLCKALECKPEELFSP